MNSEKFRTHVAIWDFDRSDSLFHAKAVIRIQGGAALAKKIKATHRYAVLLQDNDSPSDSNITPFSTIQTLEAALRSTLAELEVKTGMKMLVHGLPDTVRMIERVINSMPRRFPLEVTFQPQMDGTTLG